MTTISTDFVVPQNGDSVNLASPTFPSYLTLPYVTANGAQVIAAGFVAPVVINSTLLGCTNFQAPFSWTITGFDAAATVLATGHYSMIGKIAFVSFDGFVGTGGNSVLNAAANLPGYMCPQYQQRIPIRVAQAPGSYTWGQMRVNTDGAVTFYSDISDAVFTSAASVTVFSTSAIWQLV